MSRQLQFLAAVLLAMLAVAASQVSSLTPSESESNRLRLAELDAELSEPSLVELSHASLLHADLSDAVNEHVQPAHKSEAAELASEHEWNDMSIEQQKQAVEASLVEVESAAAEGRRIKSNSSSLLYPSSKAPKSSSDYWSSAWNRRWWCNSVRWGYQWIESHPHWQRVCAGIEQFRPWGWWSHMCHNIYNNAKWGAWYRSNYWWKQHCDSIRNPHYKSDNKRAWLWHPGHKRHAHSRWCEQHGHRYRDLNNPHYNHWCHGREQPKGYKRSQWEVDIHASEKEQQNYWFCLSYRGHDDSWKINNKWNKYQKRCTKGEGARGAKHPGFNPALSDDQLAALLKQADKAGEKARVKATAPKWRWSKSIPRSKDAKWCEDNGLIANDTPRFVRRCEGNRETEAERVKRVERAVKNARKRVLARIPSPDAVNKPVKQIKVRPFVSSPALRSAKRDAAIERLLRKMPPKQAKRFQARLDKLRKAAKKNLPQGVKDKAFRKLMKAMQVAVLTRATKRSDSEAALAMPDAPDMPDRPANAPSTRQLKKIARLTAEKEMTKTGARKNRRNRKNRKSGKKQRRVRNDGDDDDEFESSSRSRRAADEEEQFDDAGQPIRRSRRSRRSRGSRRNADDEAAAPASDSASASSTSSSSSNSTESASQATVSESGVVSNSTASAAASAASAASAAPALKAQKSLKAQSAARAASSKAGSRRGRFSRRNETAAQRRERLRKAARRARIEREDEEDREESRRRRLRRKQYNKEVKSGKRGENRDWKPAFKSSLPNPKAQAKWWNRHASAKDGSCPRCKLRHMRKKWEIVLDPTTVSAIDLPLIEELHHRVDYLIEPQEKKMQIAQNVIESAAKQAKDAEEHHIRIYDFALKHKDQLLIPQRIQDEQKEVQLE